jgi:hypothetical protein
MIPEGGFSKSKHLGRKLVAREGGQGPTGLDGGPIGPPPRHLATHFDAGCSNRVLIPKNPMLAH